MLKRAMTQLYFAHDRDDCGNAMGFYQDAFGGKKLSEHRADNGDIIHAEMDIFGQVFAFSEIVYTAKEIVRGNGTEFWFHFEKGQIDVGHRAYNVLKEGAAAIPKFSTDKDDGFWDEWCFCVTDKYGITWGLFC